MRVLLAVIVAVVLACAMIPSRAIGAGADSSSTDTLRTIVPLPEIEVSTTRLGDRAPLARSVLDRDELKRRNWGQDTPMALAALPGVYAYSDAGNGIGYSYLSIRGFPQRRISVLIDGVPLNDPESHEVYWIDHPDLLASTSEAQVQRGVGSALYGAASVGGSVDLETMPYTEAPSATGTIAYGSYDTKRLLLEMNSGRLAGGWSAYARYSRIETSGYRDDSWSRLWSYALGARKVTAHHSFGLKLFGGPEETHLAYRGITRSELDGLIAGRDRRFNPLTYPGEADHFFEPHYELLHSWRPREGLTLTQTLFFFDGRGYYDERRFDLLSSYRLDPWAADSTQYPASYFDDGYGNVIRDAQGRPLVQRSDLVRHRFIQNHHYGWTPRVEIAQPNGSLIVGGELRAHDGHHVGTVITGDALPPGTAPDHAYYDYHPNTLSAALFAREEWRPAPALSLLGDVAWRHQRYSLRDDVFGGYAFDQDYDFVLPRLGATWQPRAELRVFGSWAYSSREPRFSDLFSAEQAYSVPLFQHVDPANGVYADPIARPEKVHDYEVGAWFGKERLHATVNLFHMTFRDELVDYQFDSNLNNWITTNAAESVHQGVEVAGLARRLLGEQSALVLEANATFGDNHFVSFAEQIDSSTTIRHDGNTIAFFPNLLANAGARLEWGRLRFGLAARYAGRIYLDTNQDATASIAPRTVLDGNLGLSLPLGGGATGMLDVRVFNLLDREYETGGYFDYDDSGNYVPLFVPAATRNAIAQLTVGW
jgi:iron complex outermembrane receptor protein